VNLKGIITGITIFLACLHILAGQGYARPMITDLSERKIDINANFTGKEILLYGARVEAGQIVIVIRGPSGNFMVRKKERIAGMWINTGSVKFTEIPQFYRIASSRDLEKLDAEILMDNLQLGMDTKDFHYKSKVDNKEIGGYKQALLDKMAKDELIDFEVFDLPFLEGTLFRIRVNFPEKVLPGIYSAEIYSFNEGRLLGMQSIPIKVEKVGIEATVHNFAHDRPVLYGLFAIFIAALMGWVAGSLFRKV
jgi:uncharacterized protein (TIGR02186 family)